MTGKIYKSAMGTPIDMGALALQNQNVRAVGNMNVNARGDSVDSQNKVVEQRNRQVQRQYERTTSSAPAGVKPSKVAPHSSSFHARRSQEQQTNRETIEQVDLSNLDQTADSFNDLPEDNDEIIKKDPIDNTPAGSSLKGGLAGAIARSREIKQEREKSLREIQQQTSTPKRI